MTLVAPPNLVEAPPLLPLSHGLFSAVTIRSGERWESGIQWEHIGGLEGALGISAAHQDALDMVGLPKTLDGYTIPDDLEAVPFTVYADFKCSPVGFTPGEAQRRAEARLAKWEERLVESAFWTGSLLNSPTLNGTNMTGAPAVLTADGTGIVEAIAALEDYFGTVSQSGVIHMRRSMLIRAVADKAVRREGGHLITLLGTPVVAGGGYPGTAPDGNVSAATTWVYGTGPIVGYRSEVFTSSNRAGDLLDRANNDLLAVAERTYVLAFDPSAHAAVEVTG